MAAEQVPGYRLLKHAIPVIFILDAAIFVLRFLSVDGIHPLLALASLVPYTLCLALFLRHLPEFVREKLEKNRRKKWLKLFEGLEFAFAVSAFAPAINMSNANTIESGRLLLLIGLPFLAITAAIILRSRKSGKSILLVILPLATSLMFCSSAVFTINRLPLPAHTEYCEAAVTNMDSSGTRASTIYRVTLEYEGNIQTIQTNRAQYSRLSVGDTLDISVHTGFLGIEYIEFKNINEG